MTDRKFNQIVGYLIANGDLDHPDEKFIKNVVNKFGVTRERVGEALFTAIDMKSLKENEIVDGGDGRYSRSVDPELILQTTFSRGEK